MRIILLTFHNTNNYGALLQCYALKKVLANNGHEVDILDIPLPIKKKSIRTLMKGFLLERKINPFRKKYFANISRRFIDYEDLRINHPTADYYIVGSDQVWNPQITKENVHYYFFNFLSDHEKRISYAASFGLNDWQYNDITTIVSEELNKFSAISVREKNGVNICQNIFGINAHHVLDPTFLLDDYSEITGDVAQETDTLVSYQFAKKSDTYSLLNYLSVELKLTPISMNDYGFNNEIKYSPFMSVNNWLKAIKQSRYVITNSFHCMVFAIKYKKPFIALPASPNREGRMLSLLRDIGLENRYYNSYKAIVNTKRWKEPINYDDVFSIINDYRDSSLAFLKNSLK